MRIRILVRHCRYKKLKLYMKKILCVPQVICQRPYPTKRSKVIFNGWKSGLFVNFCQFPYSLLLVLDPEPHSQNGSGSSRANSMRIRIRNTACPQVCIHKWLSARSQELRPRFLISIVDPWHFGTNPSVTFKMPKNLIFSSFFAYYFLKAHLHYSSNLKRQTEVTKQKKSRFFILFLLDDGRIRIHEA